ncbi:MAG: hypothetical protein SOX20_00985 [Parolsenella sp.]|uniref:hypothetical protein n=1 Tax=Parolsenella sp. TaxID=2083006 RepID=UPI002A75794E|nr:hypothetical protein [Parolsenella sp.]MCI5950048.1 hypothetical protein [Coriobacteriaceae bacterium]MDY3291498.1 hypothetical protein [Parolsenella sp.]
MRTILYVGSSTDLSYEHGLLEEWGKRGVTIAQVSALNADDVDATAEPAPDPLQDVDVVVLESGEMNSGLLESHPSLSAVVILDDKAKVDVEAATRAEIWVTHAANRAILFRLPFVNSQSPSRSARRHALQDALASIAGERPSGRVNEL